MLTEIFVCFILFFGLFAIGFGPSLLLFKIERNISVNRAIIWIGGAPAIGLAIVTLLAFPLYRYGAPVKVWGVPVAIALILASGLLAFFKRKELAELGSQILSTSEISIFAIALAVVAAELVLLPLVGGINRVIFFFNPSDTLTYLTLSESTRNAPWEILWAAAAQSTNFVSQEILELLKLSPTGAYSARRLIVPIRLATMIDLAWFAQVTNLGVERLLYSFYATMSLSIVAVGFSLLRLLGTTGLWSGITAAAIALNYWTLAIRDHDAYSQIHCLPLLLLFFVLRIDSYQQRSHSAWFSFVAGVILAAVICAYTEFTAVLVAVFVGEMVIFSIRDRTWRRHLLELAWICVGALCVLLLSGQLFYLAASLIRQFNFVVAAKSPIGSTLFDQQLITNSRETLLDFARVTEFLLGFTRVTEFVQQTLAITWVEWLLKSIAISASIAIAATAIGILFWEKERGLVLLVISFGVFSSVSIYFAFIKRDYYSFFKVFSMGFPTLLILTGTFAGITSLKSTSKTRGFAQVLWLVISWFLRAILIIQLVLGAGYLLEDVAIAPQSYLSQKKLHDYDFTSYNRVLDHLQPKRLLVYTPPSEQWWYSAFVMFAVKNYNPYFQSGYLYDNGTARLFHPGMERKEKPDYVLISRKDDYINQAKIGDPVFEGDELIIYKIISGSPEMFSYRQVKN